MMMAQKVVASGTLAVGVDVGGTNVRAGVIDEEGHILTEARRPALAPEGADATIGMVKEAIKEALIKAHLKPPRVVGIGMGIPGIHDSAKGVCRFAPNFPTWQNVQLVQPILEEFDRPAFMLNDVATATLGEYVHGAGRGYRNVVMITLGTGIGGGAVIDGELRLGTTEGFAEVGHQIIIADGPECGCGNHGCWEALAGRDAIVERARRLIEHGRVSSLPAAVDGNMRDLTPAIISEMSEAGDEVARQVIEETAYYVGLGCFNLVSLYDPEILIVGGGIARVGKILFEIIERTVRARGQFLSAATCKIAFAELGDDAGMIGGAALARWRVREAASREAAQPR
jgi:glucokinase